MATECLDELFRVLTALPVDLSARALQDAAAHNLEGAGFAIRREVPAPYIGRRGIERAGRIDIWAERGGVKVAVEVDRRAPRRKSIIKLRTLPEDVVRVIVVRDPGTTARTEIPGIDRIIFLGSLP